MTDNAFLPFPVKITSIVNESDCEFTMTVEARLAMTPGQFFQVSLPKIGEAPISISNYGEDWLQFTIRAVGRLTSAIQNLRVGENLFIRGPYGTGFPIDRFCNSNLIIVAGGSGVAPVRPLISQILAGRIPAKSLHLIAGFKSKESILFAGEIETWKKRCQITLTIDKPQDGWDGDTGLVTEHIRRLKLEVPEDYQVVVVGPPVMMKFSTAEFRLLGIPVNNIWVSFERHMSCGLGKCGHCKIDNTYVCLDGPVMNLSHAATLID